MVMRKLVALWAFLDFFLLAAGVLSIVASIMFTQPQHLIMNMIEQVFDFKIGLIMGVMYLVAVIISILAILSPVQKTMMLKMFNMWLLVCMTFTLGFATVIWIFSLRQRAEFQTIWSAQTTTVQQAIQDTFSCCGYMNGTAAGLLTTQAGFCSDATFAANQTGCITPITSSSSPGTDFTLESMFSTIYGFELILGLLFLATVCVINERGIAVRFIRIDEKRGGGGFV